VGLERVTELHRGHPGLRAIEDQNIRANFGCVEAQTRSVGYRFGEQLGVLVVDMQTLRRFFQRQQSGRRAHTGLTHAAAKHFAVDAAFFDEFARTSNH